MNIMLVSQCSKRALTETRRVLDQFAERKGSRTWQTPITQNGLMTLRKMLRKTARRNTAVACHWIKSGNRTELMWVVGNANRFNASGTVPTNTTRRDILRSSDENLWHRLEDISLLAGIAALFHDFGKAIYLFQQKLRNSKPSLEPYRHEWISFRLFQAYITGLNDQEWLTKLLNIEVSEEQKLLERLQCDGISKTDNPFKSMPPLARVIGWLIVAHHRLPKWPGKKEESGAPRLGKIDKWLNSKKFNPSWNSDKCITRSWSTDEIRLAWQFNHGLPIASQSWQNKAHALAKRALKRPELFNSPEEWMTRPESMHLARMFLMLSDHIYSAKSPNSKWQDKNYKAYANTDRQTRALKQKLDEHLVGVCHYALLLGRRLPMLKSSMPNIGRHRGFKKRSANPLFRWQDKAYELACSIKDRSVVQGFFGINMASTGCGKTFANGRIMYGLANEDTGCRFNVALGLRTLTLQTGDALRERLHLQEDDLAVLIGSRAVRRLYGIAGEKTNIEGSTSSESLFDPDNYVRYEGALDDGPLSRWLEKTPGLHQLVSAPILVSTIDYLMPATEGERGGRQIGPMLRLLTSDLVLDEPDDFDIADLPALCRLVNWAGMLGSRVLVSSATLPPSLISALFDAYRAGRRAFQEACGEPGEKNSVCCAWFDENRSMQSDHTDISDFIGAHNKFVSLRIPQLKKAPPLRKGAVVTVQINSSQPAEEPPTACQNTGEAIKAIAGTIHDNQFSLHATHGQTHPKTGKKISIGLIRMANINPLVAVAETLMNTPSPANQQVHYCVYHGQHPLAVRSSMEQMLDNTLDRHHPDNIWQIPEIKQILVASPEADHLFVVLATSVAEVGRDHDYDWAIAEPSSMRSLIQLAGRIQRHRQKPPVDANLLVLSHNYKALTRSEIAFSQPGFETNEADGAFSLTTHDLHQLITSEQINTINAIPRISENVPLKAKTNLADLEHAHLKYRLFGNDEKPAGNAHASLWWKHNAHWSYELQRRTPFRKSAPDMEYVLFFEAEGEPPKFHKKNDTGNLVPCDKEFQRIQVDPASGVSIWGEFNFSEMLLHLAESMDMGTNEACRQFGMLRLREQQWRYHPALGIHGKL